MTAALRWRAVTFDGKVIPNHGQCLDGEASIGGVRWQPMAGDTGVWAWNLTADVPEDLRPAGLQRPPHGRSATKDEAKAGVEAAYHRLIAGHPDTRQFILDRAAAQRRRDESWRRREML